MKKEQLASDIYVLTGKSYESIATVLVSGDEALLIDALASRADAEELKRFLDEDLKKEVRFIILTHYMSDHMAALRLFPKAQIIAHKNYARTFKSQKYLSAEEAEFFIEPTIIISDDVSIKWGRLTLNIFHNPSHTMSTIGIDIPEADLLLVGDAIFGNTVFLSSAGEPELFEAAIKSLQSKKRSRIIPGHIGIRDKNIFDNALFYLKSLQAEVRKADNAPHRNEFILNIPIEACLAPQLTASDFEKEYHRINLDLIIERKLFAPTGGELQSFR